MLGVQFKLKSQFNQLKIKSFLLASAYSFITQFQQARSLSHVPTKMRLATNCAAVPLFQQYIAKRLNAGVMMATQWIMKDMDYFNSFEVYLNALYSPELSEECQTALWEF